MVKHTPWLILLLNGCALERGHAGLYVLCDHQVHMERLYEMSHAKCDNRLPLQFNIKF